MRKIKVYLVIIGFDETHSNMYYCVNDDYDVPNEELNIDSQDSSMSIAYKMAKDVILAAPSWYDVIHGGFVDSLNSLDNTLHLTYQVYLNTRVNLKSGFSWKSHQEITNNQPNTTLVLKIATQGQK